MIDPLTSLAFTLHSSRGVYALMLGSGISRAAEIPTGWEITLDLIAKAAAAAGEECGASPATWFQNKYGRDPDYSDLLNSIAKTPADRANVIAQYFEPTPTQSTSAKKPTAAHRAIARLAARGYFRVLVTTNFDRLLEQALEAEGVSPTVIASSDAVRGAMPLAHSHCTVIKLHGDYRDTRLRNTAAELERYDPECDALLDKIFDEYGLLICGWSGMWDTALRSAIVRAPNRRFSTYWTTKDPLAPAAQEVMTFRAATEIRIDSADAFFAELEMKLDAIDRYSRPHPLSAALAGASVKKFIVDDQHKIELRDLAIGEAERLLNRVSELPVSLPSLNIEQIFERMKVYESASEVLLTILTHGGYWGRQPHSRLWGDVVARVGSLQRLSGGLTHLVSLRNYPACLSFYALGMASLAASNYSNIAHVARDVMMMDSRGEEKPLVLAAFFWNVLDDGIAKQLPGYERRHTPLSDRLFDILRDALREYLPDERRYEQTFDKFEYMMALVHLDLRLERGGIAHAPVGRFGWRCRSGPGSPIEQIASEAVQGDSWDAIRAGLFPSVKRFQEIEKMYREEILPRAQWY